MSRARQIEEQAALWVVRREEPSWSEAEEAELEAWLTESDAHKAAFWRLECGWREADRIASLGAPLERESLRFGAPTWWRPAALAASLLLVGAIFLLQLGGLPLREAAPAMRFATAVGGHEIVSLADGSKVELNTDTAIRAAVDGKRRAVWLDRGEAFFDVARRQGRPFVIYAGARTITVLGTKFSVRRDPREIVVAVLEGRVQVDDAPATGRDRHATVAAGDVAIARERSTLVTKSPDAVEQQLAWRSGLLVLDGASLAAAAEQFNRYNRKRLVIADAEAARLTIDGRFEARNAAAFARLLEANYGLNVEDQGGRILVASRAPVQRTSLRLPIPALPSTRSIDDGAADACGPGGAACALIPLAPPAQPVQVASVSPEKAIRDANNWSVLHKLYPPRALAAREEGLVGFVVKLDSRGNATSCKITQTSGHPLLDLETCKLIVVHATFKRPAGTSVSQQRSYEGVVNWKLPTTPLSSVPPAPKPIAEANAPEELICRRFPVTGSNAAFERRCMPKSEWQNLSDESKRVWDRAQGRAAHCGGKPCD